MSQRDPKQILLEAFEEAVSAAQPANVLAAFVPSAPAGRIVVVGAGNPALSPEVLEGGGCRLRQGARGAGSPGCAIRLAFHQAGGAVVGWGDDGTHAGGGKGGRNSEFGLAFALEVGGIDGISMLAADTDGRDGSERDAGVFADGSSVARMRAAGVDPDRLLTDHSSWDAFSAVEDLITTGPTGTNVNDLRAILVQ